MATRRLAKPRPVQGEQAPLPGGPAEEPGSRKDGWSPSTESGLQACYGKSPGNGAFSIATFRYGQPALAERLTSLEPVTVQTRAGEFGIVPKPWGTRGYDDLRIRANRESLGRGARPAVASVVDCVRMLDASEREIDTERIVRMRRMMELERQLVPSRGLTLER